MQPVAASFQSTARYLFGGDYPRLEAAQSVPEAARPKEKPIAGPDGATFTLQDGTLTARKPDGTVHWSKTVAGELQPPLVDGKGNLYLVAKDGTVTSLDPGGEQRWETKLQGQVWKPATRAGDDTLGLIASVGPGQVVNLDATTGKPRFERNLMPPVIISGLYGGPDGNLYLFNGNDHALHCYKPDRTGWKFPVGDLMGPPAFAADGTMYVPRSFGDIRAVDPATGKELWKTRYGSTRPEVNDQGVVRSESNLLRIDPDSGTPVWTRELPEKPQGAPVSDASGHTFVQGQDTVYALTTLEGQPQASFQPGGALAALPEGALVSDPAGTVHTLSLKAEHLEELAEQPTGQVVQKAERVFVGGVAVPRRT